MSLSNYKLPHYIFVVFPLAAIITAKTIWDLLETGRGLRFFKIAQPVIALLLMVAVGVLLFVSFSPAPWFLLVLTLIGLSLIVYYSLFHKENYSKVVMVSLIAAITVNFALSTYDSPTLLKYQAGSVAGKELKTMENKPPVYSYHVISHGLDFYSGEVAPLLSIEQLAKRPGGLIFTIPQGLAKIEAQGIDYEIVRTYNEFHVTELTMGFLNPSTREKAMDQRYLIRLVESK